MRPTFDATSAGASSTGVATVTSLSWSHTCSGSDRYVLVFLWLGAASGGIGACTYGGVAMNILYNLSGRMFVFGLKNPPTGAKTISLNWTTGRVAIAGAVSYNGVSDVLPAHNTGWQTGTTSPTSAMLYGDTDCLFLHFCTATNSTTTIPTVTNQGTSRFTLGVTTGSPASAAIRLRIAERFNVSGGIDNAMTLANFGTWWEIGLTLQGGNLMNIF